MSCKVNLDFGLKIDLIKTFIGSDDNGTTMRQVITTFPGKGGIAMLMIMGSAESWDEEEINAFIESIH